MKKTLSKIESEEINIAMENFFNLQKECRKKGHAKEEVISHDEIQTLCICGNCKEMYKRPSTDEERKKYYNLINTPYFQNIQPKSF
jgi:hypothetical protein